MKLPLYIVRLVTLLALSGAPLWANAQAVSLGVSVNLAPPALPIYEQPPMPAVGYMWTPGYWAWGPDGYYWVPGTWVLAPALGLLWTPGYWGCVGGAYFWHGGYWGPHVGFYGGVNYGFGYGGVGYSGGFWRGGAFQYNHAVNNFGSVSVRNFYNQTVINNGPLSRVSYNGGAGGTLARPTPAELQAGNERHQTWTPMQSHNEQAAEGNRSMLANVNHGAPGVAATARPGEFSGAETMRAHASSVVGSGFQPPPRFRPREPSATPPSMSGRFNPANPAERAGASPYRAVPARNPAMNPYRVAAPRPQVRGPAGPAYRPVARQPARVAAPQQRGGQREERR